MRSRRVIVTGGAGFIGSSVVRHLIMNLGAKVLVIDKLTYAANLSSLASVESSPNFRFVKGDICDGKAIAEAIRDFRPEAIMHLAAESHVDRSIDGPAAFIETNIVGTFRLLEAATSYWRTLSDASKAAFRFHHISTDEVFGALGNEGKFRPETPYDPRSPYSASKASADHLVRAWYHTHGLPVIVTNCSNNYGPFHFPEKLVPLLILKGLNGEPMPIYGDGSNVRDWLHVDDHARGLALVVECGRPGETYLLGGEAERTNLQVVETICDLLDVQAPRKDGKSRRSQITFVPDRPGHDYRYAIDATKIREELGWKPQISFTNGMAATVQWYLVNRSWWQDVQAKTYRGERLGLG